MTITDKGIGFDTSQINSNSGIGLSQVISRIEIMNGIIGIDSQKQKGTKITIQVPVVDVA